MEKVFQKLFWDCDATKMEQNQYSRTIIERTLELGNFTQIKKMFECFDKELVKKTLQNSRQISSKSANFWADYFNLPKEKILCLNKQSNQQQPSHWQN